MIKAIIIKSLVILTVLSYLYIYIDSGDLECTLWFLIPFSFSAQPDYWGLIAVLGITLVLISIFLPARKMFLIFYLTGLALMMVFVIPIMDSDFFILWNNIIFLIILLSAFWVSYLTVQKIRYSNHS